MPIKAFIFDMDDVLCAYDVEHRIARLAMVSGRSEVYVRQSIWESDYFTRADRGEWTAGECLAEFGTRLGFDLGLEEWIDARRAAMRPFADMLALVDRLGAYARVALLTNNDLLLAETLDVLFPALGPLFGPHLYVSAALKRSKPDPEIFRMIATRLDVAPHEAVFTDDLAENVAGAQQAGLHAIRFENFAQLQSALGIYGVPARVLRG